jgi:hypothetical protein
MLQSENPRYGLNDLRNKKKGKTDKPESASPKKNEISLAAESRESEP